MKITRIVHTESHIIETDEDEYPTYRRNSADDWENMMGCSWEPVFETVEIEQLFQKAIKE
jgi:hypothetical protein